MMAIRRILLQWFYGWARVYDLAGMLLALILVTGATEAVANDAIRLAVTCQVNGKPSPEIQDLVTSSLSNDPQVEVLERSRIDLLIDEGGLIQNPERRVQLGRFLSLDYFLNLRRDGTNDASQWIIEAVNAQSSQVVGSAALAGGTSAEIAPALAAEATKLIHERLAGKAASKQDASKAMRIAVLDFSASDPKNVDETGRALRLSADVREFLSGGGMAVLDRELAQQVAREHGYQQEGMTETAVSMPLLGADCVVIGKLAAREKEIFLDMTALDTRQGRIIAAGSFPYNPSQLGGSLPDSARKWLLDTLRPARTVERTFEESIQVEALEPFYSGIAKFSAGQILEATDDFQKAYTLNEKFADAMLWEARCYDALGLKPIGDAERRFVKMGLNGRGYASSGKASADEAITFLGITSGTTEADRSTAQSLEMLAIDQLSRGKARLQLASHLAPLRDEYDVLVGTENTRGTRWTDAPNFVSNRSLRGELSAPDKHGNRTITWVLVDTLGGKTFPASNCTLGKKPGSWRREIEPGIAALLKKALKAVEPTTMKPRLPSIPELESELCSRKGIFANIPLLKLLLRDPANGFIPGRSLSKGDNNRTGLSACMNFGLREYLLQTVPASDPQRPWLELEQLQTFHKRDQTGSYFSGRKVDVQTALTRLLADRPADLSGCFAEYMLVFDQLGGIDPKVLAERLNGLEKRLGQFNEGDLGNLHLLSAKTEALRVAAQIASGTCSNLNLPTDVYATPMVVSFDEHGKPWLWEKYGDWRTNEWQRVSDSASRAPEEARASLAILGRGDDLRLVKPQWLTDFPSATVMLSYAIDALDQAKEWRGRPLIHEFDAEAERQHFRNIVTYSHHGLMQHLDRAQTAEDLQFAEDQVDRFIHYLTESSYIDTVSDADWERMRQELAAKTDAAEARIGSDGRGAKHRFKSDWRTVIRRPNPAPVNAATSQVQMPVKQSPDRENLLREEHSAGERSWSISPLADKTWSKLVQSKRFGKQFNASELARIYLPYLPRLKELFPGPDLSLEQLSFLYNFGSTLMLGGEMAGAEEVFTKVLEREAAESDVPSMEVISNAALQMAWICRASGRKAEALNNARRALDLSLKSGKPFNVLRQVSADRLEDEGDSGTLRAVALRLVGELRNDAQTATLPERVKSLTVRTPDVVNVEVTCFYRAPPNCESGQPRPVLIIAPIQNDGALSYCLDASPWARFGDEHGVFLLVPQFINFSWGGHYQAGQSILDALEQIHAKYNIDPKRLLLHGYGAGTGTLIRFARRAPERCAGLSFHSTAPWDWADQLSGGQPLSSLRNVPCIVTTGDEDGFGCFRSNRLAAAIQFATFARGAGVPVLWKALPGVGHYETPEMEQMCIAFLASCLDHANAKAHFTGDIRSGTYYASDDVRVEKIPKNFQQAIPTRELAEMWGTRMK